MPPERTDAIRIPQLDIQDTPGLATGSYADVARYFFSVDEVKRFIDLMAFYKLNTFHWHLTEDAAGEFRLINTRCLLMLEHGVGVRKAITIRHRLIDYPWGLLHERTDERRGGYASKRNITIIPEFDMPGHTLTVLAAYPSTLAGGPFKVLENWEFRRMFSVQVKKRRTSSFKMY